MPPPGKRRACGGLIERTRPLDFTFDRKHNQGFEGDTLASALLANGVYLTGRSFKYHRPRGIQGSGYEEPATVVQLAGSEDATNMPVTRVALYDRLVATSINCWPSPNFDVGAVAQTVARLLPAGFYYKTFMWPHWHLFEPFIRRAAGLGRAPSSDPKALHYETRFDHCDVLVVGAGPAGLMAAQIGGRSGARVLLVDDDDRVGGRLLADGGTITGRPASDWISDIAEELDDLPNVTRLRNASAWAYHEHNFIMLTEQRPDEPHVFQRTRRIRAKQVIVATGAIERPIVFANNDRPGVMLASAARTYVNRYAVKPGVRTAVFSNNDSAWQAAVDLDAAGVTVVAIVDVRQHVADSLTEPFRSKGTEIHLGSVVKEAIGAKHVKAVRIASREGDGEKLIQCDLLCVSGGWNPAVHLFSQSRGTLRYDTTLATFVPHVPRENTLCAGSVNGKFDLAGCLSDGLQAGRAAVKACKLTPASVAAPQTVVGPGYHIEPFWGVGPAGSGTKAFVDVQNDVTVADLELAAREGFAAVEHAKRYTTAGMGVDQGKTGNVNVIGVLAGIGRSEPRAVGTTTFRPPYVPVEFGAIAGHRPGPLVLSYRHTPMTQWHQDRGAVMYEAGARWRRPGYYPLPGESFQQTVNRESAAVRHGLGIYDGTPLGKFELRGPDALALLELVYTNRWADLIEGHGRYGLMLTDDGLILDDGVSFKLGDGHYLMTTSTARADAVYRHLEEMLQVHRKHWQVNITPVTEQWANATVCGPKARDFMMAVGTSIGLTNQDFPFMCMRDGTVAGVPARVFRVSYTGELSYEINVACRYGLALWEALISAGERFGVTPIGSEANHVLRVEKGFLSLGHEVDGTADPHDLGISWLIAKNKDDFIGKRALEIRRANSRPRRELVGLLTEKRDETVPEGSPITPGGRKEKTEGFVSACVWSVVQERTVALAMLENGRARMGESIAVRLKGKVVRAEVTAPAFYDPKGEKLRS